MKTKPKPKRLKSLAHIKKLSTLLALGLRDLRKQERAPQSKVDMGTWLDVEDGICVACLAGSVCRFSLHVKPSEFYSNRMTDAETDLAIDALDELRKGKVTSAANYLGVETSLADRYVASYYSDHGKAWWSAMRQLLKDLKAAGE